MGKEMAVYIANFGKTNWAWPECLKRQALAVMDDDRIHPYWKAGDRAGYIAEAQRVLHMASGQPVIKTVASRWFNLNTILMETVGDLWIHREKQDIWWSRSIDAEPEVSLIDDPSPHSGTVRIFVYYKRCAGWSNRSKKGAALQWDALHPRAKQFLFTEGTFQQLSEENAAYVTALIDGGDLSRWHKRADWQEKQSRSKHGAVTTFDSRKRTIARMADNAWAAAQQSGTISITTKKDKVVGFQRAIEMESYIDELLASQEGLCALTDLGMTFDDDDGDPEFRCSLDRIDSNAGYIKGNLQVVCRFANRWKGTSDNTSFVGLIEKLRSSI